MSEENKKRYDAFISYRHSELDSFVAINLQRKLENFKLPKNVQSPTGKNAITRVFRDEDELPIASSLSEQIENALNETDFLIVICTPRLPESKWCEKEMETFIKLYGREKILAVLAEGEPSEAFPKILTTKEVVTIDSDGNEIREEIKVEPLAADVRGTSKKEILKKMDDAILRIAAPVFEINYDDLKQRHRERKMKRIISIVSFAAACMLVFSLVCMGMLIRISKQSDEIALQNEAIQKQNEEIQARNDEIEEKNKEIEEQYVEAAKKYAISMVDSAAKLGEEGRNKDAIYALRQVMPDSKDDTSIPYTSEALYKMTELLELYPGRYSFYDTYEIDTEIVDAIASQDGKTIVMLDNNCIIHVFDVESGEKFTIEEKAFTTLKNKVDFLGNDYLLFLNKNGKAVKQNLKDINDRKIIFDEEFDYIESLNDRGIYCLYRDEELNIYNIADDSLWASVDLTDIVNEMKKDNMWLNCCLRDWDISDDSRYIAGTFGDYEGDSYFIYDVQENKMIDNKFFGKCMFTMTEITSDNILYLACNDLFSGITSTVTLRSVDCKTGKEKWNKQAGRAMYSAQIGLTVDECECVVMAGDINIMILSREDGRVVDECDFYEELGIVKLQVDSADNLVRVYTKNCSFSCYWGNSKNSATVDLYTYKPNVEIEDVLLLNDGMLICPKASSYVTLYKHEKKDAQILCDDLTGYPYSYRRDGQYYLVNENDYDANVYLNCLYNIGTGEKILSVSGKSTAVLEFVGEDQKEVVSIDDKEIKIYNVEDGSLLREITPEYKGYVNWTLSNNHNSIYGKEDKKIVVCSLEDGHIISETEIESFKITEKVYITCNDRIARLNKDKSCIELYDTNSGTPEITVPISKDIISKSSTSDDGRYIIFFGNDRIEFYDTTDNMKKTVLFNESVYNSKEMKQIAGTDYYMLEGYTHNIILDENMKPFMSIPNTTQVADYANKKLLVGESSVLCCEPLYDYEDIIRIADERVGDYVPPQRIIEKYNISVK